MLSVHYLVWFCQSYLEFKLYSSLVARYCSFGLIPYWMGQVRIWIGDSREWRMDEPIVRSYLLSIFGGGCFLLHVLQVFQCCWFQLSWLSFFPLAVMFLCVKQQMILWNHLVPRDQWATTRHWAAMSILLEEQFDGSQGWPSCPLNIVCSAQVQVSWFQQEIRETPRCRADPHLQCPNLLHKGTVVSDLSYHLYVFIPKWIW